MGLVAGLESLSAEAGEFLISKAGLVLQGDGQGRKGGAEENRQGQAQCRQCPREKLQLALSQPTHNVPTVTRQPPKVNANPNFSIDVAGQPDESDPTRETLGTPSRPVGTPGALFYRTTELPNSGTAERFLED
jgi:hypothetical protein